MKRALAIMIVFAFVGMFATLSHAADMPKPIHKLVHGVVDIVKSPLEIYDHTKHEVDQAKHKPFGFLKGIVESPFYIIKKAGHGLVDVVTFPIE